MCFWRILFFDPSEVPCRIGHLTAYRFEISKKDLTLSTCWSFPMLREPLTATQERRSGRYGAVGDLGEVDCVTLGERVRLTLDAAHRASRAATTERKRTTSSQIATENRSVGTTWDNVAQSTFAAVVMASVALSRRGSRRVGRFFDADARKARCAVSSRLLLLSGLDFGLS